MSNDNWSFNPPNIPILRCELGEDAVDHIWKCIDTSNEKVNYALAGNISESFSIDDIDSKFWNDHLSLSCESYLSEYRDMMTTSRNPFNDDNINENVFKGFLGKLSKRNRFQSTSSTQWGFILCYMDEIPTEWKEQYELPISKNSASPSASDFMFTYTNILGGQQNITVHMSKESENNMVIFPSTMMHQVYPFYNCSEDRITVSGNIFLQL